MMKQSTHVVAAAATLAFGCIDLAPETDSVESAGILNGILNGFLHPAGLTQYLDTECPLLKQRLLHSGDLEGAFPPGFQAEIAKTKCEKFMFYTAELMVPFGQTLTLSMGTTPVATFAGGMGLEHLVAQAYPGYTFAEHAFTPAYPAARKIVTQGYAALTNGITRTVSYKTGVPALDAHRAPGEDAWPREFTQLVPFSPVGISAMVTDKEWLARLPDFFNPCFRHLTNYDYVAGPKCSVTKPLPLEPKQGLIGTAECQDAPATQLPFGYCPVPIVVHGNLDFVDDIVPGRSCRILRPNELPPIGSIVNKGIAIPANGCPLIYYVGNNPGNVIIYDDHAVNPPAVTDGCDFIGPSSLTNCDFDVTFAGPGGSSVVMPDVFLDYYVFNVEPIQP